MCIWDNGTEIGDSAILRSCQAPEISTGCFTNQPEIDGVPQDDTCENLLGELRIDGSLQWVLGDADSDGIVTLQRGAVCLAIEDTIDQSEAVPVVAISCSAPASATWRIDGGRPGDLVRDARIIHSENGKCLTIDRQDSFRSALLIAAPCDGSDERFGWRVVADNQIDEVYGE